MPLSRRKFLSAAAVVASAARLAAADELPKSKRGYSVDEIDAKLRRAGRPENLFKDDLPTPALLVDLDVLEKNLAGMADFAKAKGKLLRPHAKMHKCVDVARRQQALGAIGTCVATVPEAVVMAAGGIGGLLLTSPIASAAKAARMAALARDARPVMVAVDHVDQVALYEHAAEKAGSRLDVLVDLNVGDRRTGIAPGEPAAVLARAVSESSHLQLRGLQAYSGGSSHVMGFAARTMHSRHAMEQAVATSELFAQRGLPAEILSGTSTGTYDIDVELATTEMQVGSYAYMDVDYRRIGDREGPTYDEFGVALTVLATVVSANHPDRATLDAGFKAFATDRTFGPEAKDVTGVKYAFGGDEFGILTWDQPSRPIRLGNRLEFIVPHCDPTVNLYDRVYACRSDRVEEIWSIMDRLRLS